jgi:hypothetical protein
MKENALESNASVSEEPSPEAYVTESETSCDAKEVNTTESLEAIEGDNIPKLEKYPTKAIWILLES